MPMSVVRSSGFIKLLLRMKSTQVIFLSLGSRPLLFTIYGSNKIIVICLHWMYSHATVTFENVFRLAYETLSSVLKCFGSNICLCYIFLIKL